MSISAHLYFYCKEKKNRIQMIRFQKLRTHKCLNLMTLVTAFVFLGNNIHYNFLNQKHLIHTEKDHILIKYQDIVFINTRFIDY